MFILIFITGLCVGSFLNVIILRLGSGQVCRLPEKRSIVRGRSACPRCKEPILWYDLIPLMSFFILKTRCRHCREKISWQYPLIELATGLAFVLLALYHQVNVNPVNPFFYRDIVFFSALIIIFVTDLKCFLIFDAVVIPMMAFAFLANVFVFGTASNYVDVVFNLIFAAAVGAAFFLAQYLLSKGKWLGAGDIRLGLLMGLMLGWPNVLAAIFIAYIFGAIASIILLLFKIKKMKSQVPLGVFLSLSTMVMLIYGNKIIDWYVGLMKN
ncbi:prepilin peptidase [Candidatus Falkowbacteria bacterium]|nr:prepilin peptidase [Candidatus Falkowbacteria bacterium]